MLQSRRQFASRASAFYLGSAVFLGAGLIALPTGTLTAHPARNSEACGVPAMCSENAPRALLGGAVSILLRDFLLPLLLYLHG